ncbi:hypothetical protein [Dysgonomonas macrotermitis]|uniref:Uncharacterized protein n=1 Tax=Dysgonomonas macrotermitis TaxID=1346286 RepID=A0A1M4SZK9_9BACT|nr:hypothetical protein [Dysgonomonas macrotermitis]SHE37682.1 hypothetical protein SAMN05444362_101195 [Dysgonomonas macrotermitis]
MRKIFFISAVSLFFQIPVTSAQGLIEGKCSIVIENLRNYYQNDSLAIEYFKSAYVIDDLKIQNHIYVKKTGEVLSFFLLPENKNLTCSFRGWRNQKDLIIK